MGIRIAVFAFFFVVSQFTMGQAAPPEITDSDVISMTKAGIGEATIVLAIQHGPAKFDTSPQALIALKGAGVSDQVLNAILESASSKGQANTEVPSAAAQALFKKVLDAIGPHDKIAAIHAYRWKASGTAYGKNAYGQGTSTTIERETIRAFPDSLFTSQKVPNLPLQKTVITPEFSYRTQGAANVAVSPSDLDALREGFQFDFLYIAQHPEDYTISAEDDTRVGDTLFYRLKVAKAGKDVTWEIDPKTSQIFAAIRNTPSGDVTTEYGDWRLVEGVHFPFMRSSKDSNGVWSYAISDFAVNPVIGPDVFQPPSQVPAQTASQGLKLKILQEQSVPYTQQLGGGISTSCNIVGTANTSASLNAYGNSAYGNATTNSNQHMSCNSYDTTLRLTRVLNVMFAEASDGNSYMFACDRAWRWSKCVPLRVGQVFNAHFTDKGLEVEAFDTKGKEENPTYHVLQSRSLR